MHGRYGHSEETPTEALTHADQTALDIVYRLSLQRSRVARYFLTYDIQISNYQDAMSIDGCRGVCNRETVVTLKDSTRVKFLGHCTTKWSHRQGNPDKVSAHENERGQIFKYFGILYGVDWLMVTVALKDGSAFENSLVLLGPEDGGNKIFLNCGSYVRRAVESVHKSSDSNSDSFIKAQYALIMVNL
jgi:hypothetical protein